MKLSSNDKSLYMTNAFSQDIMEQLFVDCPEITVRKNADVYRQGDLITDVYWLYEGLVEVYVCNEEGMKQVIAYHYPNSFVADIQAISEEETFLNCTALKKSKLRKCKLDSFLNHLLEMGLIKEYLKLLVGKSQANVVQLAAVSLEDCETRIKRYYNNELTHQQIAELVGCSRVQVSRVINRCINKT